MKCNMSVEETEFTLELRKLNSTRYWVATNPSLISLDDNTLWDLTVEGLRGNLLMGVTKEEILDYVRTYQ